jgi:hypothetical protein
MNRHVRLLLTWAILGFAADAALASIIPLLDVSALCDRADLVIVGRVVDVRQRGPTIIVNDGTSSPGRLMVARLDVERVLKGAVDSTAFDFTFSLPSAPVVSSLHTPITVGQFGVFLLRKADGDFEVLDPYYPSVVASPGGPGATGNLLDQVTAEVAGVFASRQTSPSLREQAVRVLRSVRTPAATVALRAASRGQPVNVRLSAIGALLSRNDISELAAAEHVLLHPPPGVNENLVAGLAYAIGGGVKDPRAIPTLARLLPSKNVYVRRAAAAALRNTRDGAAIKPLTEALYDSDREVQYQAVIGLAEITGTVGEWAPASGTFEQNPKRYLDHWREWAKAPK